MPGARAAALSTSTAGRGEEVSTWWDTHWVARSTWLGGVPGRVPGQALEVREGFLEEVMANGWSDSGREVSMAAKWR